MNKISVSHSPIESKLLVLLTSKITVFLLVGETKLLQVSDI